RQGFSRRLCGPGEIAQPDLDPYDRQPEQASTVVIADTIFTATAALLQPATGSLLARSIGWELSEGWIALSLLLYVVTGL
ncbi:DUF2269 family protein, partial [Rhizobium ruizarguesonis]